MKISILFLSLAAVSFAQTPVVTFKPAKGFPAVSSDGSKVAILENNQGYDDHRTYGVQIWSVEGKREKYFEIIPSTHSSKVKFTPQSEKAIREANTFLSLKAFESMEKIQSGSSGEMTFKVEGRSVSVFHQKKRLKKVQVPKQLFPESWCRNAAGKCNRVRYPETVKVWVSLSRRVIAISYGFWTGPHWAEVGPLYKVTRY